MKLVDLGIPKELVQMDIANFQQQAMDIIILFLGKGSSSHAHSLCLEFNLSVLGLKTSFSYVAQLATSIFVDS